MKRLYITIKYILLYGIRLLPKYIVRRGMAQIHSILHIIDTYLHTTKGRFRSKRGKILVIIEVSWQRRGALWAPQIVLEWLFDSDDDAYVRGINTAKMAWADKSKNYNLWKTHFFCNFLLIANISTKKPKKKQRPYLAIFSLVSLMLWYTTTCKAQCSVLQTHLHNWCN